MAKFSGELGAVREEEVILASALLLSVSISQYGGDFFNSDGVYLPFTQVQHGQYGALAVSWIGMTGYVNIDLCQNYSTVASLATWVSSEDGYGSWVYPSGIPSSWGSGSGYRLRISDSYGTERWSDSFSILSNCSVGSTSAHWAQGMTNAGIVCSGFSGSVSLYLVTPDGDQLSLGTTSSNSLSVSVQEWMGTGNGYKIKAVDSYGNSALSSLFSINDVYVSRPSQNELWERGVMTPEIRWTGEGSEVKLSLISPVNGYQPVLEITDGWVPNTGRFSGPITIPEYLPGGYGYFIEVSIRTSSGEILEGSSGIFSLEYSNNEEEGALQIGLLDPYNVVSESIEYQNDVDYWSLSCIPSFTYTVRLQSSCTPSVDVVHRGTVFASMSDTEVEWDCFERGEYYVRVTGNLGDEGPYSLTTSARLFPEASRPVSAMVGYTTLHSEDFTLLGTGIETALIASLVKYTELGVSFYTLTGDEAFSSIIDPDSSQTFMYLGVFAGLKSPEISRFTGHAGIGYDLVLSEPLHYWMNQEYESMVDAYQSGIHPYVSLDFKVYSQRFGNALFLRLQRSFLDVTSGRTSLGLVYAIQP